MAESAIQPAGRKQGRIWHDILFVLIIAALAYCAFVAFLYIRDPYGRSGLRSSAEVSNLPERAIAVSRAMDPQFNAAIVGNSTSIPLQPEFLDKITGRRFVSLSISGSGPVLALNATEFFFRFHKDASAIIVALDDSWCTRGDDVKEQHPYPAWLYGSTASYVLGLFRNASLTTLMTSYEPPSPLRIDGYHPYDEAFRNHDFDDMAFTLERLNRATRPTEARYPVPYLFDPPNMLSDLIKAAPASATFVLFWTPRYLTLRPVEGTPAAASDTACKQQIAKLASSKVRVVDWSGPRPENDIPGNFYAPNHYRDGLARIVERDIAGALQ